MDFTEEIAKHFVPMEHHEKLYKLISDVSSVLKRNGITHWIDGGTLLGAVRHQEIIPWDDDADFGVFEEDWKRTCELEGEFKNMGYECSMKKFILKVYINEALYVEDLDYYIGCPCVDIFSYSKWNGLIRLTDKVSFSYWPRAIHLIDLFFPLKEYKLGPLSLLGPNDPFFYLNGLYPHWDMVAVIDYRGKDGKKKTKKFPYLFGELFECETPDSRSDQ